VDITWRGLRQRPTVDGAAISCTTVRVSPRRTTATSTVAAARGTLQLGVAGTLAVTRLAEAVHMAVLSTTPLFLGKHLTRGVYAGVRVAAGAVGQGGDSLLRFVERQVNPGGDSGTSIPMPVPLDIQAVLNGIVGDRLVEMNHSAALPMRIRSHSARRSSRDSPDSGDVLFVHGLCMHDRHWQGNHAQAADYGAALSRDFGLTPLYLRYNSGLSIGENGRRLATLLAQRSARSRNASRPLHIVAHSLGGLVVRSALATADQRGHRWTSQLSNVVFLGPPHEGAPLERAGKVIESLMSMNRFSAPWTMLARLRSIAIRQLGDAEVGSWPERLTSPRVHVVAGSQSQFGPRAVRDYWGDGLVPVSSALAGGVSASALPVTSRSILQGVGHLSLIRHPEVLSILGQAMQESGLTRSPRRRETALKGRR
jgi:pimeloyl-ACP methyl ester carboxylesterase